MGHGHTAIRRILLAITLVLPLSGCIPPQTLSFNIIKTDAGTYVYPPGPEVLGEFNVLVEGVAKPKSNLCKDLPFNSVNGNKFFSLRIGTHNLEDEQVRTAIVGVDPSVRSMDRRAVQLKLEAYLMDLMKNKTAKACLKEGAAAAIQARVLDSLPVNTNNVLRDVAGYDAKNNMVEVRPGEEVCVNYAETINRFVPDKGKNGWFTAGSQQCYPVTRLRESSVGGGESASVVFDAFLARLPKVDVQVRNLKGSNTNTRTIAGPFDCSSKIEIEVKKNGDSPSISRLVSDSENCVSKIVQAEIKSEGDTNLTSRWVSGPIDLNDSTARRRQAFHIFYPSLYEPYDPQDPVRSPDLLPVMVGSSCPGAQKIMAYCRSNNALLSEICLMKDNDCIDQAVNDRTLFSAAEAAAFSSCKDNEEGNWAQCYVFRDRGIPVPYIRVSVNGADRTVPVGTTLGDILDSEELLPFEDLAASIAVFKDTYPRPPLSSEEGQVVWDRARWLLSNLKLKRRFAGRAYPVDIESYSKELLYMPVLQGDEITW